MKRIARDGLKRAFALLHRRGLAHEFDSAHESTTPADIDQALIAAQAAWLRELEEFRMALGVIQLPPTTPMLTDRHLQNCRLLANREAILEEIGTGVVAAEVGVHRGNFSSAILEICRPSRLHLIDLDLQSWAIHERFKREIDAGIVSLHEGDSSAVMREFADGYLDFAYIDADHSYLGVKGDIDVAKRKVRREGLLVFDDYTYWSPGEGMRYGVMQAVNELCVNEDWEALYFALEPYMYCNVAIRRR